MDEVIGDYKIERKLGEGGSSAVYLAHHRETGKYFAAKFFNKKVVMKNHMEKNLNNEIKIMASLDHPNIVKLIEVLKTPDNIVIIMEYADGGQLFDLLKENGPLSEDTARKYFQQLIDALDYMHKQNQVHRDLKLENVLVTTSGNIKIIDFGLSTTTRQRANSISGKCGTPHYMAPEVYTNSEYGPCVDIWSAGIILYTMLHARLPFDGTNFNELKVAVIQNWCQFSPNLSEAVVDLIKRMLERYSDKRINISQIRKHEWFRQKYILTPGRNTSMKIHIRSISKSAPKIPIVTRRLAESI